MNRLQKIMLGLLLIVSLACGNLQTQPSAPALPTLAPGAINTYIAQTAGAAQALTALAASPTPTFTLTPTSTVTATETPLPKIAVYIEKLELNANVLLLIGQLTGTLAETGYQSFAKLSLFDAQRNKLLEEEKPCLESSIRTDGKLCTFIFMLSDFPAGVTSYELSGRIQINNGSILAAQTEDSLTPRYALPDAYETAETLIHPISSPLPQLVQQPAASIVEKDISLRTSFSSLFYTPENGSSLSADVTYFGDVTQTNVSDLDFCVSISERRKYESGKTAQVVLTEECKTAYLSGSGKIAKASNDFFFKPSGYSFVSIDSPEGSYQISEIRATVKLTQNEKVLATSESSHRPVPVRLIDTSLHQNSQASAKVKIMAGQGETYDLKLKVYQIEGDPDETVLSMFLLFIPCLLPGICDDRIQVGEAVQPIKLIAGTTATISASYTAAPASEDGNFVMHNELLVFFEDIAIGKK